MHKNHLQLSHFPPHRGTHNLTTFFHIIQDLFLEVLDFHSIFFSSQRFERKIIHSSVQLAVYSLHQQQTYYLRVWGSHEWFHHQTVRLPSYENILSFGELGGRPLHFEVQET